MAERTPAKSLTSRSIVNSDIVEEYPHSDQDCYAARVHEEAPMVTPETAKDQPTCRSLRRALKPQRGEESRAHSVPAQLR